MKPTVTSSPDTALASIAEPQHGAFSRDQARACGFSDRQIARRVESGVWRRSMSRVFRTAGTPITLAHRQWSAVLWAGPHAVLSHATACRLWHLDGIEVQRLELWVRNPRAPRSRTVRVHRTLVLDDEDVTELDGLPVTSAVRTVIDAASFLRGRALESVVESARRSGVTTTRALVARLELIGGPGRPGADELRRVLALQSARPAESELEIRVARVIRRAGMPTPVRQLEVRVPSGPTYRLDFAWPELRVALECDGWRYHEGRARFEHDERRRADLAALGWLVVPVTWQELRAHPAAVIDRLRRALGIV
jgi:very-short-patch-repair endonuclease